MEDPAARRARLKALREEAQAAGEIQPATKEEGAAGPSGEAPGAESDEPTIKFRNYAVKDEKAFQHVSVSGAIA